MTSILITVVLIAVHPQVANAVNNCFPIPNVKACVIEVMSNLSEMIQSVMSWFLSICGAVLNMSILLTLNMKAIYQATPAIEQVWIVIRNIASIFIIFGLLYTSICTILDIGKTSVSAMVKNIIIAGLLINFSLLFARTMIDASNLVSMQFYRAIAPNTIGMTIGKDGIGSVLSSSFKKGGISDAFMSSLKIPKIYDKKQGILQAVNAGLLIIIHTYMGALMMIIAGLSFIAAALAFTARIAILLLIMAFSPLYFVGIIFPKIKEHTKEYENMFINQLIFMPVYLLLTYVSLRFLSGGFFSAIVSNKSDTAASLVLADVGMIFQYVIALIMINVPLIAALKLGAMAPKWAGGIEGIARSWTSSSLWNNTGGRAASKIAKSEKLKNFAASSVIGEYAYKGIKGAAKDYNEKLTSQVKARTDFAESLGEDSRLSVIKAQLSDQKAQLKRAKDMKNDDAARTINAKIAELEAQKNALDNKRKEAYANRISSRTAGVFGSSGTLWTMIARKDKAAAKEIQNKIKKDEVESLKKKIEDEKPDLKRLENKLRATAKEDGEKLSKDEEEYLEKLRENLATNQSKISKLEIEINS